MCIRSMHTVLDRQSQAVEVDLDWVYQTIIQIGSSSLIDHLQLLGSYSAAGAMSFYISVLPLTATMTTVTPSQCESD